MKMSTRKIFSIIIASLSLYLFINMFFPYYKGWSSENLWEYSTSFAVINLVCLVGIIAVYVLQLFNILKEKWVNFVNYAVGYVSLFHLSFLFYIVGTDGVDTGVGLWLGVIVAIAILVLSVLWYFMSDEALGGSRAPITGYDAKTGKPIYAKQKGFDPHTGKPIFEE